MVEHGPAERDAENAQGQEGPTLPPKRGDSVSMAWWAMHYVTIVFAIGLLFCGIAFVAYKFAHGPIKLSDKPQSDSRVYLTTKLSNGLEVVAVEDPRTTQAAFAVAVEVGSFDDPMYKYDGNKSIQKRFFGLTHLLEHMLFLGTKKYPDPDEFHAYISQSGGSSNAYTSDDVTVYYASMSAEAAIKRSGTGSIESTGMDRFADFFRAPLFDEEGVDSKTRQAIMERELQAVDSEHQKNRQDPGRRVYSVLSSLAAPESPVSWFHTGNTDTLKTEPEKDNQDTFEALRNHFRTNYCTPRMHLVMVGPLSAKEQLLEAEEKFGRVPQDRSTASGHAPVCSPTAPSHLKPDPWPEQRLRKWVDVVGTTPFSSLEVWFRMPDLREHYAHQPLDYIRYVLSYHGEDSLFHILRDRLGLAYGVSVGGDSSSAGSSMSLSFALTDQGRKHPEAVLHVFFAYVARLQHRGVDRKLLETLEAFSSVMWQWQEPTSPASTAETLAERLTRLPTQDILWGDSVARELDPKHEKMLLDLLVPNNALFIFVDPSEIGTKRVGPQHVMSNKSADTLPYYGVKYLVRDLDVALGKRWEKWLGNHHTAENELPDILTDVLGHGTDGNVLPEQPAELKDVPKLSDIKLSNGKAEVTPKEADSIDSAYGPHPVLQEDWQPSRALWPEKSKFWYRRGWVSNAPKFSPDVSVKVLLRSLSEKGASEWSAKDSIRMSLYQNLFVEEVDVALADVGHAGGSFSVSPSLEALGFGFGGLHTALKKTVSQVLEKIQSALQLPGAESRFPRVRQTMEKALKAYTAMPVSYAISDRDLLLTRDDHSKEDLLDQLRDIELEEVQSSLNDLFFKRPLQVTSQAMGNLAVEEAQDALSKVLEVAASINNNASREGWVLEPVTPIVNLKGVAELRKLNPRPHDPNDVAVVSVVIGVATVENRVILSLLGQVLSELSFSVLRTQKKMGYVAFGGVGKLSNVLMLSAAVQGDQKNAHEMAAAIEYVFFKEVPKKLNDMKVEDVRHRIESFVASLKEVPFHTGDEVGHFWGTTVLDEPDCFDLLKSMLKYAQLLGAESKLGDTKKMLITEWDRMMFPADGDVRSKLVVKYFAEEKPDAHPKPDDFKQFLVDQGFDAREDSLMLEQLLREQEDATQLTAGNAENRNILLEKRMDKKQQYFDTKVICKATAGDHEDSLIALPRAAADGAPHHPRAHSSPSKFISKSALSVDEP